MMSQTQGFSRQSCRLLAVLSGKFANKAKEAKRKPSYPFPELVSSGRLEVHTLVNPTLDSFRNAQKSLEPNILYFQGEQLENEEDIGMLVWGDLDVSEPEMFSSLIVPPLPTIIYSNYMGDLKFFVMSSNNSPSIQEHMTFALRPQPYDPDKFGFDNLGNGLTLHLSGLIDEVYLEVPNGEKFAQALQTKGTPYVIYWRNTFSASAASHFCQALLSVVQSSCSHVWDAFQLAQASFHLYCARNNHVLSASVQKASSKLGPHLLGNAPKINIILPDKAPEEGEEISSDTLPVTKIYDDDVDMRFLVCGLRCTLDTDLLGSLEDGLNALLNVEIRGSKLNNRISAAPPTHAGSLSHGVVTMRCDLTTCSSAHITLLISGSAQTCFNDQLLESHIKNELIEKSQLVHALPDNDNNKPPITEPLPSVSIACGASAFEVRMKVPSWAAQVLKQLAPEVSYRSLVTLGIASIQGIPVASFEKEDADRFHFFWNSQSKDSCFQAELLSLMPSLSSSLIKKRARPSSYTKTNALTIPLMGANGVAYLKDDKDSRKEVGPSGQQRFKVATMRPIPCYRRKKLLFSRIHESASKGSQPMLNPLTATSTTHVIVRAPLTHRKSMSSSPAQQIISLNPLPVKKHECSRCSIQVCSEEEFLGDVMQFLVLRGHHRLVPQGGVSEFPDVVLNAKRLDLFNLYREVVSRGGFYVGNGINWKGQVFSKMRNYTVSNRMTGVGNTLKRHYETYLLEYELAHDDVDGECCLLCHSSTPGDWVNCGLCGEWAHFGCDRRQGLAAFKDYAKTDGLDYICPNCSLTNSKRKPQKVVNGFSDATALRRYV